MRIIISDTTALIVLAKTHHLDLLSTFVDRVYIPEAVMEELSFKDDGVRESILNAELIVTKNATDIKAMQRAEEANLDRGEKEAIALALETGLDLLIDEKAGRRYALSLNIPIFGLLGVLKINLLNGTITMVELLYILEEFKKVNYRISPTLERTFIESLSADWN